MSSKALSFFLFIFISTSTVEVRGSFLLEEEGRLVLESSKFWEEDVVGGVVLGFFADCSVGVI